MKAVKNKVSLKDYRMFANLKQFCSATTRVLSAYSDCLPDDVDSSGMERSLDYFENNSFTVNEALLLMKACVPNGYNYFQPSNELFAEISDVFGGDCQIFIAREGSVCLYIKPSQMVWFSKNNKSFSRADEFSFDQNLGLFRLWWD